MTAISIFMPGVIIMTLNSMIRRSNGLSLALIRNHGGRLQRRLRRSGRHWGFLVLPKIKRVKGMNSSMYACSQRDPSVHRTAEEPRPFQSKREGWIFSTRLLTKKETRQRGAECAWEGEILGPGPIDDGHTSSAESEFDYPVIRGRIDPGRRATLLKCVLRGTCTAHHFRLGHSCR